MPSYPHIERYYAALKELIEYGGSDNEQSIRPAFQNCLTAYCADHREKLVLVPELESGGHNVPDGTVKDSLRMTRGYWEAKDTHDDLDAEIQRKFDRGYPQDNIIFEDSRTAILIQNREMALRVDMSRPGDLHRLLHRFLDYQLPDIAEFRQAQQQFKADLPAVLENLRAAVAEAAETNPQYQEAAARFLTLCRQTIGPAVTDADVREMLLQHILTKDIFLRVFAEDQFHRENNIARQLDALERTFFTGDVRRQAIDRLRAYYGVIGRSADEIADYAEKQQFLKAIYEDFYQAYNPAAADYLGVVYTPNEVVDFIIRGTDWLLQKHFGRALADENVQILDPATGTGTFVTSLINYLPPARLEQKYRNEIHANEVAILPYYIANLNIEYSYKERTGRYLEFPNLCFVDTLDNMDWQAQGATGGAVQRQSIMNLGGLSEENWLRLQEQNEKPISVIIGNPPYNANQQNENDNNKNREYPEIDRRIKETYIAASAAQKTKQYDMYKRFIRWASDRLADDGIIAFVSNSSFLEARQDDGFRKVVAQEFNELWVVDLKGNARTSGERRRREGGNVFDNKIRVGVAIYFLVRRQGAEGFQVFYNTVDDYAKSRDKVEYVNNLTLDGHDFRTINPDSNADWFNESNSDFEKLIPLASRQTKLAKAADDERAVFSLYSMGVVTNRDEWVYDFSEAELGRKVRALINAYEESRAEYGGKDVDDAVLGTAIKWTRDLKRQLRRDIPNIFTRANIRQTIFRPFVAKSLYFSQNLNEMQYQLPEVFPEGSAGENKAICFCVNGKDFYVLATNKVVDLHFTGDTQCLPLYRYTADGERVSNITDWAVSQVNEHYRREWGQDFEQLAGAGGITAEDIFAYTYAVLHDPVYRYDYRFDLLREFPRLPYYINFRDWVELGQRLLDLHLGFETAEPYPLKRLESKRLPRGEVRPILRANRRQGTIALDDKTTLAGIPELAWEYVLGSRTALEWVLDQYKERKPKDPTIADKFNTYHFADYKEPVIDLLQRVCTVSVRTAEIVGGMAYWQDGYLVVSGDRDQHDWSMLGMASMLNRPDDGYDDPEVQAWLASLPDIREGEK